MRQIGAIESETSAGHFVDYLKTIDIPAQADEDEGRWVIWVRDEGHLESARKELQKFESDPDADQYKEAPGRAAEIRSAEIKKRVEGKKNVHQVRGNWTGPLSKRAPVVMYLIVACVAVAVLGGAFEGVTWVKRLLKFADVYSPSFDGSAFYSIFRGQIWRLVTPIFLHAPWVGLSSILHIVFNLYWLRFMGSQIESRIGSQRFVLLVLLTAIVPNVLQAVITGPNFVGISGVVYGLFGYILVRRRDGYQLDQFIIMLFLVFFVLDFTPMGFFKNVAVWAGHAGGLAMGALFGYLPTLLGTGRR